MYLFYWIMCPKTGDFGMVLIFSKFAWRDRFQKSNLMFDIPDISSSIKRGLYFSTLSSA